MIFFLQKENFFFPTQAPDFMAWIYKMIFFPLSRHRTLRPQQLNNLTGLFEHRSRRAGIHSDADTSLFVAQRAVQIITHVDHQFSSICPEIKTKCTKKLFCQLKNFNHRAIKSRISHKFCFNCFVLMYKIRIESRSNCCG